MPLKYTPRVCENCGKDFLAHPSNVRRGGGRFCSKECDYADRALHTRHKPEEERFWANVEKTDGCWLWKGWTHRFGYGGFSMNNKSVLAHRAAWILFRGPIPEGVFVCHTCDVPQCVNPNHLFLGTQADNMSDAKVKGRMKKNPADFHPRYGENHPTHKLTAEQVLEIRRVRAAEGVRYRDIAARFGTTSSTVADICLRRTWKHL